LRRARGGPRGAGRCGRARTRRTRRRSARLCFWFVFGGVWAASAVRRRRGGRRAGPVVAAVNDTADSPPAVLLARLVQDARALGLLGQAEDDGRARGRRLSRHRGASLFCVFLSLSVCVSLQERGRSSDDGHVSCVVVMVARRGKGFCVWSEARGLERKRKKREEGSKRRHQPIALATKSRRLSCRYYHFKPASTTPSVHLSHHRSSSTPAHADPNAQSKPSPSSPSTRRRARCKPGANRPIHTSTPHP